MKIKFIVIYLLFFVFSGGTALKGENTCDPKADSRAVITSGNARFTVLTPEMLRIE